MRKGSIIIEILFALFILSSFTLISYVNNSEILNVSKDEAITTEINTIESAINLDSLNKDYSFRGDAFKALPGLSFTNSKGEAIKFSSIKEPKAISKNYLNKNIRSKITEGSFIYDKTLHVYYVRE